MRVKAIELGKYVSVKISRSPIYLAPVSTVNGNIDTFVRIHIYLFLSFLLALVKDNNCECWINREFL